jgi:hydrogenase maturation protease
MSSGEALLRAARIQWTDRVSPSTVTALNMLVIGYGNDLRSDDGVGPRVAEAVTGWQQSGLTALAAHQLLPELIADLASVDRVVFVDATLASTTDLITLERVVPREPARWDSHWGHPAAILGLARQLGQPVPEAWFIQIPGECFELGENLSPRAGQGMEEALRQIRVLWETP